jgi:aspartate racemase
MKTIGMIGGIGPESTIAYYRLFMDEYRARKQDGSYPSIIINNIKMTKFMQDWRRLKRCRFVFIGMEN